VRAQHTLVRVGELPATHYTIRSGWAFRYVTLPESRRQILEFLLPGDSISLENLLCEERPAAHAVKALTALVLCVFDPSEMRELVRRPGKQQETFCTTVRNHLDTMDRRLADVGQRRASGRIAQLLLELEGRLRARGLSEDGGFEFPARQEHLADALGLSQVHVNRILVGFRKDELIAFGRGRMKILNMQALTSIALED
jgi:CRP-like cAMP-binding protein